ncbi:MAG: LD-carboxypeptidase [Lachnospiraceae bacterium]|nr:LD-carboxypeptidase [Lachnospiraceae bacterium]
MRYPAFLKEGGRIGLVAPSFGCATEPYISRLARAMKKLKKKGFELVEGPNIHEGKGIGKSNLPELCGLEINRFFTEDNCDVILSVGGGETMCEDLEFVDFESIRLAPAKWYMGYSDNTNLTFTLPVLCDTAAIYGINAPDFGMKPWHKSVKDHMALLQGKKLSFTNYKKWEMHGWRSEDPSLGYHVTEPFDMQIYVDEALFHHVHKEVRFSGRLIGGCLDVLVLLCGTPFGDMEAFLEKYKEDGFIWFLESCDLNPMAVRRAIWQLKNAGWLKYCNGFLIGRSLHLDEVMMGETCLSAYIDCLKEFNVPILLDLDIGHKSPRMPMLSGAYARVNAETMGEKKKDRFCITYELH